jgi:hypothetical protein
MDRARRPTHPHPPADDVVIARRQLVGGTLLPAKA